MSIVSTLGDLSARFVSKKQFDALDEYVKKLGNQAEKEQLQAISQRNLKMLDWDRERLAELKGFLKGSAATKSFSVLLSIVLLSMVYVFQ